jgi:hypothetical protein
VLSIPAFWPEFLFSVFPISDLSLYFYFQLFQPMKSSAREVCGCYFTGLFHRASFPWPVKCGATSPGSVSAFSL